MRLFELLQPGTGDTYYWGDKVTTIKGKYQIERDDAKAKSVYFVDNNNQLYVINFDATRSPESMTLSFGNVDPLTNTVNYFSLRKFSISQAAKILNTVVDAASKFSQAVGGVPLWVFTSSAKNKAKVYQSIATRLAKQIGTDAGVTVLKDPWQDYIFLVYQGTRGQELEKKYRESVDEFKDIKEITGKISESVELKKNRWEILASEEDKLAFGDNLVDLVHKAYSRAPLGSFITSVSQVVPSDWRVIDLDDDPDIDAAIFYRKPRKNEHWIGRKIQGIGHDKQTHNGVKSSEVCLNKLVGLLNQPGWWIECSDRLREELSKRQSKKSFPVVTDTETLRALFNDPALTMIPGTDTYRRKVSHGEIVESVFGKPVLKGSSK